MELTHIKLRNWRNFPKVEIALSPRTFVYDPNAAGKSNFLDVFCFLADMSREEGGLQRAVKDRNGFSAIRSLQAHGREQQIEIEVTCVIDETKWRYVLHLDKEEGKNWRVFVKKEEIWKGSRSRDKRPSDDDEKDPDRLRETHLESLRSNQKYRGLAESFSQFSYMHLVPHVVKFPHLAPSESAAAMGARFLERVAKTPKKQRDALLRKVNKALKIALPQFEDLQFEKDTITGAPHLKAKYVNWRPQGG
jgi:predicted ATPase